MEAAEQIDEGTPAAALTSLPLDRIQVKKNVRTIVDDAAATELLESVRRIGVIQPVLVRIVGQIRGDDAYHLVAGHRRFAAAKAAGLAEIPVSARKLTDLEVLEIQLVENLQRKGLHELEEAEGYRALMAKPHKYSVATIAERTGRSEKYVYDRVKLLELIPELKEVFLAGEIFAGHAIILARLSAKDQRRAMGTEKRAWADGGLFESANVLFYPDREQRGDLAPRREYKAVSVRELQGWIDKNVRFDRDAVDPMLFPDTDLQLRRAREANEKIIPITYDHHVHPEAKGNDPRTWGPASWKRADGECESKTCEHSITGVLTVGVGRSEAFKVCVAKEKCKTHWAKEQNERKRRATANASGRGADAIERERLRHQKEQESRAREEAERKRYVTAHPAILEAIAGKIRTAPVTAGGRLGDLLIDRCKGSGDRRALALIPRGKTAEDLLRCAVMLIVAGALEWEYHLAQRAPELCKTFDIDLKAILDEHAPVDKPKPEASAKKKPAKKKTSK